MTVEQEAAGAVPLNQTQISSHGGSKSGQQAATRLGLGSGSGSGAGGAQAQATSAAISQQLASFATPAFQQVKQTQASLTRLSRGHQMHQQHLQANQSSQVSNQQQQQQTSKSNPASFVDCLIRRFRDAFSELDSCQVPVFVVGNLSPGSDGTHLILPPCVTLSCQSIGRFASQRNFRLLHSIRESCQQIEELDLGGNKLSDLVELYKILQCMPNLKFLNLSENDLSRTAPVALASNSISLSSSSSSSITTQQQSNSWQTWQLQQQPFAAPAAASRNFLAPIQQNNGHNQQTGAKTTVRRAHSTLANAQVARGSRTVETRRAAATAALAQSNKTPTGSMASKLAASSAAASGSISHLATKTDATNAGTEGSAASSRRGLVSSLRKPTSTMSLARSMSSLSAKDVKASLSRGHHCLRSSVRGKDKSDDSSSAVARATAASAIARQQQMNKRRQLPSGAPPISKSTGPTCSKQTVAATITTTTPATTITTTIAGPRSPTRLQPAKVPLYPEAINELEGDVEMAGNETTNIQETPAAVAASASGPTSALHQKQQRLANHHQQQQQQQMLQGNHFAFRRTFESIKALALNNTGCQWRVVCSILSRMPNLEELHLSLNNYERIDLDIQEFRHYSLKRLYLCNNPKLTNWKELDKLLIAFPSLEALSIADCNISQIPENLGRSREWRRICGLNINGWPIKEWPIIERLNELPSLIDLKCRNLDLLSSINEPRDHLIARLPKLQRLNGSEIEERDHAEKAFLAFFVTNSHLERPRRFHELLQIHGEVAPIIDVGDVDLSPPSHASIRVIYFNRNYYCKQNKIEDQDVYMSEDFLSKLTDVVQPFQTELDGRQDSEATTSGALATPSQNQDRDRNAIVRLYKDDSQEVVSLNVDLRQSVRKFKQTLANLFGLEGSQNLTLYYIDHEMVGLMGPELIKHNQKKLWNYNVQDGDQFIVEEG